MRRHRRGFPRTARFNGRRKLACRGCCLRCNRSPSPGTGRASMAFRHIRVNPCHPWLKSLVRHQLSLIRFTSFYFLPPRSAISYPRSISGFAAQPSESHPQKCPRTQYPCMLIKLGTSFFSGKNKKRRSFTAKSRTDFVKCRKKCQKR